MTRERERERESGVESGVEFQLTCNFKVKHLKRPVNQVYELAPSRMCYMTQRGESRLSDDHPFWPLRPKNKNRLRHQARQIRTTVTPGLFWRILSPTPSIINNQESTAIRQFTTGIYCCQCNPVPIALCSQQNWPTLSPAMNDSSLLSTGSSLTSSHFNLNDDYDYLINCNDIITTCQVCVYY